MNETLKLILNHRTFRKFEDKKVPQDILNNILESANRAPTGMGLQQFSIIRITDFDLKNKLAEISGQAYIADMPELFVFIADLYRNYMISKESGSDFYMNSLYALSNGISDALLAAQNVNITVESFGMGGVFLGSILPRINELIELLKLPKYTFPVIGYGFGYPAEKPSLKPRMDEKFRFFENVYPDMTGIKDKLKDHDEKMSLYYDLRNPDTPLPPFTKQVLKLSEMVSSKNIPFVEAMKKQGFDL